MERDCGAWVNILSHKVKRRLDGTLVNLGVNALQSRVLHYIRVHYRDGPVFQRDVEGVFSLSRSTATGVLQHLEREGFISRESVAEDGRLKSLVPTEKAAELDEQVRISLLVAAAKLSYAVAAAIKRGSPNGEIEEGVKAYNAAMREFQDFERALLAEKSADS